MAKLTREQSAAYGRGLPWPMLADQLYILCVRVKRGLVGRVIQWITRNASRVVGRPSADLGPYAHMAIVSTYPPQGWEAIECDAAWPAIYEALAEGWTKRDLIAYRDSDTECDMFRLLLTPPEELAIIERCQQYVEMGVGYDFAQLVGIGLERFLWGHRKLRLTGLFGTSRFVCSEGVAIVIRQASGVNICGKWHLSVFTPTDIRHTVDLGIVSYVGTIYWPGRTAGIPSRAAAEL